MIVATKKDRMVVYCGLSAAASAGAIAFSDLVLKKPRNLTTASSLKRTSEMNREVSVGREGPSPS